MCEILKYYGINKLHSDPLSLLSWHVTYEVGISKAAEIKDTILWNPTQWDYIQISNHAANAITIEGDKCMYKLLLL